MWVAGEMTGKSSKSDRYAGMTERQIEWGKKQSVMPAESGGRRSSEMED